MKDNEADASLNERRRAKYVATRTAENDVAGLVVMTTIQLEELVRRAVRDALEDAGPVRSVKGGLYVDRAELAERLRVSPGLIDKMRRQGMPCVYIGDSPRFAFDECIVWLRERDKDND